MYNTTYNFTCRINNLCRVKCVPDSLLSHLHEWLSAENYKRRKDIDWLGHLLNPIIFNDSHAFLSINITRWPTGGSYDDFLWTSSRWSCRCESLLSFTEKIEQNDTKKCVPFSWFSGKNQKSKMKNQKSIYFWSLPFVYRSRVQQIDNNVRFLRCPWSQSPINLADRLEDHAVWSRRYRHFYCKWTKIARNIQKSPIQIPKIEPNNWIEAKASNVAYT